MEFKDISYLGLVSISALMIFGLAGGFAMKATEGSQNQSNAQLSVDCSKMDYLYITNEGVVVIYDPTSGNQQPISVTSDQLASMLQSGADCPDLTVTGPNGNYTWQPYQP